MEIVKKYEIMTQGSPVLFLRGEHCADSSDDRDERNT